MTKDISGDALTEIARLRSINERLLAALKAAADELVLSDRAPLFVQIEAAIAYAERQL